NDALEAEDKGYKRLVNAIILLDKIKPSDKKSSADFDLADLKKRCYSARDDDFHPQVLIAEVFDAVRFINAAYEGQVTTDQTMLGGLKQFMQSFVVEILGLRNDALAGDTDDTDALMQIIITLRNEAKKNKDFTTPDRIREDLQTIG